MSFLTDIRADTTRVLHADLATAIVAQRCSLAVATNKGGEFTETWSTNVSVTGVFVWGSGRQAWTDSGQIVSYDHTVYVAQGLDIDEGDRIRMPGTTATASHYTYVAFAKREVDACVLFCARKRREPE